MLLTGLEIKKQMDAGTIVIHPYNEDQLSSNSYDVCLGNQLIVYDLAQTDYLDIKSDNPTKTIDIPPEGRVLQPDRLYLGSTLETAVSHTYIPMYEGKSSIGRLGIFSHVTAGFGDIGWGFIENEHSKELECTFPTWTLELVVVHPVRIYPTMRIGQVYFFKPEGEVTLYKGRYQHQKTPTSSRIWQDYKKIK